MACRSRRSGLAREELERGVVLELGGRVVLCLGTLGPSGAPEPDLGLVGETEVMRNLRRTLVRAAKIPVAILLRGETGTGKELVRARDP